MTDLISDNEDQVMADQNGSFAISKVNCITSLKIE